MENKEKHQIPSTVLVRGSVMDTMARWRKLAEEDRLKFEATLPDTTGWDYGDYVDEFRRIAIEIKATYAQQPIDPDRLTGAMHAFHVLQAISHRAGYRATMTVGDPEAELTTSDGTVTISVTFDYGDAPKEEANG
jgi:hypothetical protein